MTAVNYVCCAPLLKISCYAGLGWSLTVRSPVFNWLLSDQVVLTVRVLIISDHRMRSITCLATKTYGFSANCESVLAQRLLFFTTSMTRVNNGNSRQFLKWGETGLRPAEFSADQVVSVAGSTGTQIEKGERHVELGFDISGDRVVGWTVWIWSCRRYGLRRSEDLLLRLSGLGSHQFD